MSDPRYSEDHEWIVVEGDVGTVGISNHAQEQLGDIVYVELPEVGNMVSKGDEVAVVESVKAASEMYAPVTGEVVAANGKLADDPGLINKDASGAGWFFKLRLSDPSELEELMDEEAYAQFVAEQD
jgi:glycine cleavage system H protein